MAANLRGPIAEGPWTPMIQETGRPMYALPVSDIIKLASAGVKIEFKDIANQIMPDPPSVEPGPPRSNLSRQDEYLTRPLMDRWRISYAAKHPEHDQFGMAPFHVSAVTHKDKVYVFVATGSSEPCILEDELHIYPSDALMAKLHLLQQTATKTAYNTEKVVPTIGTIRHRSSGKMQVWTGKEWKWTREL